MEKMDKAEKGLLIGILVILLAIASFFGYHKFKKSDSQKDSPDPNPNPNPNPVNNAPVANDNFPLKIGSKGPNVKYLQMAINKLITNPAYHIDTDGSFGDKTYTALISGVGTTTYWAEKNIPTYPVSTDAFNYILHRSNQTLRTMYGDTYRVVGTNNYVN